jgi:hypothetical protein
MPHDDDTTAPAPTPPLPGPPADTDTPAGPPPDDDALPDGRTADGDDAPPDDTDTAALKGRARTWETRSKANHRKWAAEQKRATDLQAELDQLRDASRSDAERAIEAARRDEREKWTTQLRGQQLSNAVLRYAGSRLADPDDALRLLRLEPSDVVGDDGKVDDDAVRAAIDDLIRTKPYLATAGRRPAAMPGDQGARPRPTDDDLSKVPMDEYMRRKYPDQYHREA